MLLSSILFYMCDARYILASMMKSAATHPYNCESDRYTLGKSLFQSDKPPFLLILSAACLSIFLCSIPRFVSTFFPSLFCVVCCVAPTSVVRLRDGEPDGTCKTCAILHPVITLEMRGQPSKAFHTMLCTVGSIS